MIWLIVVYENYTVVGDRVRRLLYTLLGIAFYLFLALLAVDNPNLRNE